MNSKSSLLLLCGLAASGAGLAAQNNPDALESRVERIRALNGSVLSKGAQAPLAILTERAAELRGLIADDPARALRIAFPDEIAHRLKRSYPAAAEFIEERGRWQGAADLLIFDAPDGSRPAQRARIRIGGDWEDLHFAGPVPQGLTCGRVIEAHGLRLGGRVAVSEASLVPSSPAQPCSALGEQRIAVFPVTFPGVPIPAAPTPESLEDALFGPGPVSLREFWREGSQGKTGVSGRVFPWRTLDRVYACDEYEELWSAVLEAADPEVDFREFNRIFLVFPKPAECLWAGLANVGCRDFVTADGLVAASVAWLVADYVAAKEAAVMLAAHEGGHNLGLLHAAAREFGAEPLGPPGLQGQLLEYGDSFSAMGYWNLGHYSAPHKLQLGWWGGEEVVPVLSPGTYELAPASSVLAGAKALRIQRGQVAGSWLWVEARQPLGSFDRTLRPQVFTGALVHFEDAQSGGRSELLDFTRSTAGFDDPALGAGQEWSDPYSDLKLSVEAAAPSGLSVRVAAGPRPCVLRAPSLSLSPVHPAVDAGSPVRFTLSLTNNDSSGCSTSQFGLAAQLPDGWPGSLAEHSLSAAPGETAEAVLTMTAGWETGTFAAAIRVSRNGEAWSVPAYSTVSMADKPVYPGTAATVLLRPGGTADYRSVALLPGQ